jgi:hypothetical protein
MGVLESLYSEIELIHDLESQRRIVNGRITHF